MILFWAAMSLAHDVAFTRVDATPSVAFNVGVELGQVTVVAIAWLVLSRWFEEPWYRRRVVIPLSAAIGVVGLYWAFERTFG